MLGTIVNALAIVIGSGIGVLAHAHLPEKLQKMVFQGIGLITSVLGISMALKSQNFLVVVISIILGAVIGQLIDIDKWLNSIAKRFQKDTSKDNENRAMQGFVTALLLFCVGSMTILGSIEDGMGQTPTLLYTKAIMDGVGAIAFAATFGIVIMLTAIPLFLIQGTITLGAAWFMGFMNEAMISEMTAVGGVMLLGLGISILEIKEIKVTNMLPSLIFAIIFAYILQ